MSTMRNLISRQSDKYEKYLLQNVRLENYTERGSNTRIDFVCSLGGIAYSSMLRLI